MEIHARTEEAVFADALHALAELLADEEVDERPADEEASQRPAGEKAGERLWREIAVDGEDRAGLLAGWLNELVFLAETEDLVPEEVARLELSDRGLVATVRCHRGSPRHLVKGATYHRLAFERSDEGFHATVVLDV